jgi:hypothetical protein
LESFAGVSPFTAALAPDLLDEKASDIADESARGQICSRSRRHSLASSNSASETECCGDDEESELVRELPEDNASSYSASDSTNCSSSKSS